MTHQFPPAFATNRPERDETVAAVLNFMLSKTRTMFADPPPLAIASAYVNPAGFVLLADELEQVPRVRLLLGAEVDPVTADPRKRVADMASLDEVLAGHEAWLAAERDLTGFDREADGAARRLVAWLDAVGDDGERLVEVRRYTDGFLHGKAFITDHPDAPSVIAGSSNFTFAGLSQNAELNLGYPSGGPTHLVREWFDEYWDKSKPYDLAVLYRSRWDPHAPIEIFMRMLWELYGDTIGEDDDDRVDTYLKLTGFQREGVARMLRLLAANGGVIVADEVGLGKTFMAGEVIRRAAKINRQEVLILTPAALKNAMWIPFLKYYELYGRHVEVMTYDELRLRWKEDPEAMRDELDKYALVIVDEAHNLRNPQAQRTEALNALLGGENPKQVVLLTATPVNNSLYDLHALVSLFVRNDAAFSEVGIPSISKYIKRAQAMDPESLSPEHLFDLMDQVAVRRTRQFIKKYYRGDTIDDGTGNEVTIEFPTPRVGRLDYDLDAAGEDLLDAVVYALDSSDDEGVVLRYTDRVADPERLMLARYMPSAYSLDGTPVEAYQMSNTGLLKSGLLKRLESSPQALASTLRTLIGSHEAFLEALDNGWVLAGDTLRSWVSSESDDLDEYLQGLDDLKATQAMPAADFDVDKLRTDVETDLELLGRMEHLADLAAKAVSDLKAERLIEHLRHIAELSHQFDGSGVSVGDRRKTIVFSTYTDTIEAVRDRVVAAVEDASDDDPLGDYRGRVAPAVSGSRAGGDEAKRARLLARFAPETAGDGTARDEFDLLFTTDVLSEGVNLQQAGRIVNYDLPWNPMRIVQRHGRIDRIGSNHQEVYLDSFFPAAHLDDLLRLEERLLRKLAQADAAIGTGEVLPGQVAGPPKDFYDKREQLHQLRDGDASLLEQSHAALSGEEYRKRLRDEAGIAENARRLTALPYGSGSGFVNVREDTNSYVFCIRIAGQDKVWFRRVPVNGDWKAHVDEDGNAYVDRDTLSALSAADPIDESTQRVLTDEAYDKAFDAWDIVRQEVFEEWKLLSDPTNLLPDIPKAMRDAIELANENLEELPIDEMRDLLSRLNTSPHVRVVREVRRILNTGIDGREANTLREIHVALKEAGVQPQPAPPQYDPVDLEDIRLVTWMAVTGRFRGEDVSL